MRKSALALTACLLALLPIAAPAQEAPRYGVQLEGFPQPYPLQRFAFTSQGQDLSMGYLDVAPTGVANGQTIVLLHGKNFCAATWGATIAVLADAGYRVIAPDQVGFCTSSKPVRYQFSLAQLAQNTRALLDHLKLPRTLVMGHSMGGMLAIRYALIHPQAVDKLLLVNPIGLEDWQFEGVPYAGIDTLYQQELKTSYSSIKAYQQRFYYHGNWKPDYDRWVEMAAGLYAGPGREQVAWNQAQTSEMIFTQPVVHELVRLKPPTVLFIGGLDRTAPGANRADEETKARLGNYPDLGRRAQRTIPTSTLVEFPDLGHSPQVEAPDRFHQALLEQLAR